MITISSDKSRAEYFRKRREKLKQFGVMIDKDKYKRFTHKLKEKGITPTKWLNQKVDEELGE